MFEEYSGDGVDDVRLRPVLHVVVVVPAAGLSVLMIRKWVILPLVLFVVLLLLLLVSLSSALPHYYRHHSEQNSSRPSFPFFPLLPWPFSLRLVSPSPCVPTFSRGSIL